MTAAGPGMLQSLGSFTVTADYHRRETIFDIWQPGRREPVARLHKDGPILNLDPFQVLTGPRLDESAGTVGRGGAWAADGTRIGVVVHWTSSLDSKLSGDIPGLVSASGLRARRWRVEQAGLPILTGSPAGLATRLRFNAVTDYFLNSDVLVGQNVIDYLVPFTFRFDAETVAGFEIRRRAGRSRLRVTVRDPRIDRRLVLACVVSIGSLHNPTLRQTAVNLTTNPRRS